MEEIDPPCLISWTDSFICFSLFICSRTSGSLCRVMEGITTGQYHISSSVKVRWFRKLFWERALKYRLTRERQTSKGVCFVLFYSGFLNSSPSNTKVCISTTQSSTESKQKRTNREDFWKKKLRQQRESGRKGDTAWRARIYWGWLPVWSRCVVRWPIRCEVGKHTKDT